MREKRDAAGLAWPLPTSIFTLLSVHNSSVNHAAPAAALTLPTPPAHAGWFAVDTHAVCVGSGPRAFAAAAASLAAWGHANALPWVVAASSSSPPSHRRPAPGDPVCIAARATGPLNLGPLSPWLANPLVVVGVREGKGRRWRTRGGPAEGGPAPATRPSQDAEETLSRYEVALATTASHVLAGGERFSITHRASDGSVWFEAAAFARPASVAAAVGWPVVRALQAAFRRGAGEAVAAAVRMDGQGKGKATQRERGLW